MNITPNGVVCNSCVHHSSIDRLSVVMDYAEVSPIGRLIKDFKYHSNINLESFWQKMIQKWLQTQYNSVSKEPFTIVPIPLHPRRKRERGFNQSAILGRVLQRCFVDCTYDGTLLKRIRYTKQQALLTKEERIKNVEGVFECAATPVPKNIMLVDDVYTTGSTMQACARKLKETGAVWVEGVVIGRG